MAKYTPHNWTRGETIASSLLNHMETGIEAAQAAADTAANAQEITTLMNYIATQNQALIRAMESRITALEAK